jgi:hypothetical protein|tara:strand:+ start:126 stop:806 length:681 start_codon:yes stop_codon:yes gene_type:complete
MAHGKIRVNTLTYDTGSGDVDVAVNAIATGTIPTNSDIDTRADARITAATGVSVQAYDANLPAGNTIVVDGDIGSTVQAFDADTAKTDVAQTFTPAQTFTAASVHNGGLTVDGPYKQAAEAVNALDIDLSTGNYFTKSISSSSTVTFSNPPASGTVGSFILQLTLTGSGTAITWPNGSGGQGTVYWNGDAGTTAPALVDARTHLFMFVTSDGGTKYRGAVLKDYTA